MINYMVLCRDEHSVLQAYGVAYDGDIDDVLAMANARCGQEGWQGVIDILDVTDMINLANVFGHHWLQFRMELRLH